MLSEAAHSQRIFSRPMPLIRDLVGLLPVRLPLLIVTGRDVTG